MILGYNKLKSLEKNRKIGDYPSPIITVRRVFSDSTNISNHQHHEICELFCSHMYTFKNTFKNAPDDVSYKKYGFQMLITSSKIYLYSLCMNKTKKIGQQSNILILNNFIPPFHAPKNCVIFSIFKKITKCCCS